MPGRLGGYIAEAGVVDEVAYSGADFPLALQRESMQLLRGGLKRILDAQSLELWAGLSPGPMSSRRLPIPARSSISLSSERPCSS